jgi:hypothetical protein
MSSTLEPVGWPAAAPANRKKERLPGKRREACSYSITVSQLAGSDAFGANRLN